MNPGFRPMPMGPGVQPQVLIQPGMNNIPKPMMGFNPQMGAMGGNFPNQPMGGNFPKQPIQPTRNN